MTRHSHLVLAAITLLGLVLRLNGLDRDALWHDECILWRDVHASWPDFLETLRIGECMPPLYFALMKLWTGLVGESPLALRLPSVVFGTLTIPLLGWFVRRLSGPGAGCLAALFLAVAPFHVHYSQEARPYTFYPFIVLAATAALAWAFQTGNLAQWNRPTALARSPVFLVAFYGFLALLAWHIDYDYALSRFATLAATAVMFWALERWQGQRPGQFEIYAFVAILAFCSHSLSVLVLAAIVAAFWGLEYALQKPADGKRDWRFGVYGCLAAITYICRQFPALWIAVLGATAATFWALEMRPGRKREGPAQIYAFLVVFVLCIACNQDGESFCVLAAAVPLCWALQKWKRGAETQNKAAILNATGPGQGAELGDQRSEVRDQRSEVGDQRSEIRDQRSEVRDQRSEVGDQRSEVRDQRSEVRDQRSDHLSPAPAESRSAFPPRFVRFCVYSFLALLACYTHYFSAFFMAAHGAFVVVVCWTERSLRPARAWILCMTAVGIGFLFWLPFMLRFEMIGTDWVAYVLRNRSPLMQFWYTSKTLVFGLDYPMWLGNEFPDALLGLMPLVVWLGYRRSLESGDGTQESGVRSRQPAIGGQGAGIAGQEREGRNLTRQVGHQHAGANSSLTSKSTRTGPPAPDAFALTLLSIVTLVPLLVAWTFSQYRPSLMPRYVIPIIPTFMALMALAIWRVRWLVPRVVLAAAVAVFLFVELQRQQAATWRSDVRLAAAYIAAHLQPGDGLICDPEPEYLVLRYYLRERMPPLVSDETDLFTPPEEVRVDNLAARMAPFKRVWYLGEYNNLESPIEKYLDAHYSQAEPVRSFALVPSVKLYVVHR